MKMIRTYSVNENYFDKIDSEDKAYFLGLMYADGYNYTAGNNKYFGLSLTDKKIVEQFKTALKSTHHIFERAPLKEHWSQQFYLQINSKKMCNQLTELGCVQNKSNVLIFPDLSIVPKHLMNHFIRGYFDGDGSVWEGKRLKVRIKCKQSASGYREKIIHNVKFTMTGATSFIEILQKFLIKEVGLNEIKLNTSKKKNHNRTMEYSGRKQMKKFYDYIYQDAKHFIERKKLKFENIMTCASTQ